MPCSCCSGEGLDIFGEKSARRELRRYLRKGLRGADAQLIASWAQEGGLEGATVLEVGGGIGQVQAELLRRGAERGTVVEALGTYAPFATDLAREAGIEGRTSFLVADLIDDPTVVDVTDVVVLRRVVCCTPVGPQLLSAAAGRTGRMLLASYPRRSPAVRLTVALQNAFLALCRKRFRAFVHDPDVLVQVAAEHGLRRTRRERGVVWETVAFERS